ncbi:unnamed protein product [Linum tenue]|uniref:Secreted protein n=1 Tax=Linum tenue TaxID=586396 RepID=A0AAV0HXN2_9ROSI|nr:unnamed protein product [Linum tenue]
MVAFRWHIAVESLEIVAVVVDHVIISHPLHLALLGRAQLFVCRRCPPVSWATDSTLGDAGRSIPLASPSSEIAVPGYEGS